MKGTADDWAKEFADRIIFYGNQYDDFDDDDIPEGCIACGGDYPHCVDSCPLFDD